MVVYIKLVKLKYISKKGAMKKSEIIFFIVLFYLHKVNMYTIDTFMLNIVLLW